MFSEGGAKAHVCGFFLVHRPWSAFLRALHLPSVLYTWERTQGDSCRVGGGVGLALVALGVLMGPVGGSSGEVLPDAHGQTSP